MLQHLLDVSIRSVILAAAATLVLAALALVHRRSAVVEHAIWASVVCGTLGLLLFGRSLPRVPVMERKAVPVASQMEPVALPSGFPAVRLIEVQSAPAARGVPRRVDWGDVLFQAYLAVAAVLLARLLLGMTLAWILIARSRPLARAVFESSSSKVPSVIGWLRPRVLLPSAWRQWEPDKLRAVLAHEAAHVRRRDGLMIGLAGITRSIFWFHPLAWWLERRLALLAELACDEACVAELGDRRGYAALLIEMAATVDRPAGRFIWPVFGMAAGSHLRRRVDAILETRGVSKGLGWSGRAALFGCAIPAVFAVGAASIDTSPVLPPVWIVRSPFTAPAPPPPPPRSGMPLAQADTGAARPGKRLEFEVASIRPAALTPPAPPPSPAAGAGFAALPPPPPPPGAGGCLPRFTMDAGRVDHLCESLRDLLRDGFDVAPQRILAPDWADGARFDISARLPAGATAEQIPAMFASLLEDRFGLQFHRETREWPVSALVVSKSGLKIKPAAPESEQPAWVAAAAAVSGWTSGRIGGVRFRSLAMQGPGGSAATVWQASNMGFVRRSGASGLAGVVHYEAPSITPEGLAALVQVAGPGLDPPVVDMTGLSGRYQISLDVSMEDLITEVRSHPGDTAAVQRDWFNVVGDGLKKLGLELQPRKAPLETVVIDHLEKTPTAN